MKKWWWITGIILAVVVAGVLTYRVLAARASSTTASVQTATVTRGTITSAISAAGTVRSNQSATISWQTSGKVGTINVKIGDLVQVNDELASLDPNSITSSIIQAQTDLINAQQALEDLYKPQPLQIAQAEMALSDAQTALDNLTHPSDLAISQAQQAVVNAQTTVDTAQKAVNALYNGRGNPQLITSARAAYLLAQQKVDQLQDTYDHTRGDPTTDAGKALALSNLMAAETQRDRALAALNWYLGSPSSTDISDKETALALAQAQLADAQNTYNTLLNPSDLDIQLAQAQVNDAQTTLDQLKNGPTQNDITIAQTRVTLAEVALNQAKLMAPFWGTITDITVMTGDMVSPGDEAFRIDDLSKLFVDLGVSEFDYHSIQVGQPAVITFDAIPNKEYTAVVTKVGKYGSSTQGVVNFPVTVQITNPDENIVPGMTAAVSIIVAKHDNVLIVPNQAIRVSGNQRTVIILFEGQQISVPVTIGLTNDTSTEVTSEQVKEGDTVVINTTGSTSSSNGGGFSPFGGGFIIGR